MEHSLLTTSPVIILIIVCLSMIAYLQEFLRPIVTPYELDLALRSQVDWTGRYVLDFEELLEAHAAGTRAFSPLKEGIQTTDMI